MPFANWYTDPADPSGLRWWDGERWTEHTQARPTPAPATAVHGGMPDASGSRSPVQLQGEHQVVPAGYVSSGWVPAGCTRHQRATVATRKVTFLSVLPTWSYLLIFVSGIVFVIYAAVTRKKVVALAWPLCGECVATRRSNMRRVWVGVGGVIPLLFISNTIDNSLHLTNIAMVTSVIALAGLPLLAAISGILGAYTRIIGGTVTADGEFVVFPRGSLATATRATAAVPTAGASIVPW